MIDRYSYNPMKRIWTDEHRYALWLQVELALIEDFERTGEAPAGTAAKVKAGARIDATRINEIEAEVGHDVIAFIKCATETLGDEARWFHKGLTSSDVVDTAQSMAMECAMAMILEELAAVQRTLWVRANEHRHTITVARTHGVHAEPTSFGLKLLSFYAELERSQERLERARRQIAVGKLSGAVGNYANISPEVEARVLSSLGLAVSKVSTQVVPRDHHAEYIGALAILGGALERFAVELRHLQRTEVREAMEPFRKGQRGSSAMPHKRNPILSERLTGIARLLRSHASVAYENIALWHERDISHSSAERVIIPDATLLAFYMLQTVHTILRDLVVDVEQMKRTFAASHNLVFSQRAMLRMIDCGMLREDAYKIVQASAMQAWDEGRDFRALLHEEPAVMALLSSTEIDEMFDGRAYLVHVDEIFARFTPPPEPTAS